MLSNGMVQFGVDGKEAVTISCGSGRSFEAIPHELLDQRRLI